MSSFNVLVGPKGIKAGDELTVSSTHFKVISSQISYDTNSP
jgi:hypothetical protein